MLTWIAYRAGVPTRTTPAATFTPAATYTTAAGTTASAAATTAATVAATTIAMTEANEKIYPIVSKEGDRIFYQTSALQTSMEGSVIHTTHVELDLVGKYLPYIEGLDDDWNLLIRSGVENGIGVQLDPDVSTYEYGLYNLRDQVYRRLFRVDAISPRNSALPVQYTTFMNNDWDGDHVLFASCWTTQTVPTHVNLGIHIVSTGETVILPLDETLHESLNGGPHSVTQAFFLEGKVYFTVILNDETGKSTDRNVYCLDLESRICTLVMSPGLDKGEMILTEGRIAWLGAGGIRYVDEPDTIVPLDMPKTYWSLALWKPDLYAVSIKGPWIDSEGLHHIPEGNDSALQSTAWIYRQGERLPLVGNGSGGIFCRSTGTFLFMDQFHLKGSDVYDLAQERLITLDELPEGMKKSWASNGKLAMSGLYGFGKYYASATGPELDFSSILGRLDVDVYWMDLNDLK
ncbi:MAG: hypothetical protein KBA30_10615 [Clostridia bacterium]|nr:hypothetical protein [Clostridia bacterium]